MDAAGGRGHVGGAAGGQIIARDLGHDDVAQAQLLRDLGHVQGLLRIERTRLAAGDVTETAVARALAAHDHKGGGVLLVALAQIGAVGLLADSVELQILHEGGHLVDGLLVVRDLEPVRLFLHGASLLFFDFGDRGADGDLVALFGELPAHNAVLRRLDLVDDLFGLDLINRLALAEGLSRLLEPGTQDGALHLGTQLRHFQFVFHMLSSKTSFISIR